MTLRNEILLWDDLDRLLRETTPWSRSTWRNSIRSRFKSQRDVWGYSYNRYKALFGSMGIASIILMVVLGPFWGIWAAISWTFFLAILFASFFLLSGLARKQELHCRSMTDSESFLSKMRNVAPDVSVDLALVAREVLASSYNIPPYLVDIADSHRSYLALSKFTSPLALEVITDINRRLNMGMTKPHLLNAAHTFAEKRPTNVGELIQSLHCAISSSNDIENLHPTK